VDVYRQTSVHLYERDSINAKQTLNFVQATIYNLPFRSNTFPQVLCYHLLEHLKEPQKAVKELIRVSNHEVEIIVPYRWHETIQNCFIPKRREWAQKHHLWNFDKKQLTNLFAEINVYAQIRFRYKLNTALKNYRVFQNQDFKQLIFYSILELVFPPTPGELIATIIKKCR